MTLLCFSWPTLMIDSEYFLFYLHHVSVLKDSQIFRFYFIDGQSHFHIFNVIL